MGFVKKAVKKITRAVTKPFRKILGGGGDSTQVIYKGDNPAAAPAPAAAAPEGGMNDQAYNAAKKRKKGKGSLYVNLANGGGGGTGVNV